MLLLLRYNTDSVTNVYAEALACGYCRSNAYLKHHRALAASVARALRLQQLISPLALYSLLQQQQRAYAPASSGNSSSSIALSVKVGQHALCFTAARIESQCSSKVTESSTVLTSVVAAAASAEVVRGHLAVVLYRQCKLCAVCESVVVGVYSSA
jgi:hypothetical protein